MPVVRYIRDQVSGIKYQGSSIRDQVSGIKYQGSSVRLLNMATKCKKRRGDLLPAAAAS